jgi:alkanesulfonate monooxygenase SsuD/methylene tetrahydromethanopterin reductase-like flavin-dependent oxidoreductase (luciferase family)
MDFGAHLPLMDFGNHPYTLEHLVSYTQVAARLGFSALAVNDHMVFSVPWLDGPIALAAVMEHSAEMTLATTVSLAVVRGPVPVAKTLGAIDRLSCGRLVVAVGPGSSPDDYAAVGLEFSERWQRFDRRSARSGHCGAKTMRRSSAASTRQRVWCWSRRPHDRADHRFG